MIEYRITYLDTQRTAGDEANQTRGVSIFDKESTDTLVVDLVGSGEPEILTVINNDENTFATIRAKQLQINFSSTSTIDVTTFKKGADSRWYVEAWINTTTNIDFKGFLVTDDLQQPFLPDPKIVTLTASDHIGILKDVALVDDAGESPQGKWRLAQYLTWALAKTGLALPINVINNIRPGSKTLTQGASFIASTKTIATNATSFFYPGQTIVISGTASNNGTFTVKGVGFFLVQLIVVVEALTNETVASGVVFDDQLDGHLYDKIYLDAKTFESSEIGISESSYSVINKILLYNCFIEQSKGSWWIVRIDEMEAGSQEVAEFGTDSVLVGIETKTYVKSIGRTETLKWATANALYRLRRPYSFIKLKYNFESPAEIICNVDFSRGDFIADLPDVTVDDAFFNAQSYVLEGWTLGRFARLDPTPIASTTTAYIEKLYQYGYEKQRFAAVGFSSASTPYEYIRSCPIPINKGDKFSFSTDFRFSANSGADDIPVAGYLLYGDDGKVYEWVDAGVWNDMTTFIAGNPALDTIAIASSQFNYDGGDKTQWNTFASNMTPAPSGGTFYIYLWANYPVTSGFVYYENLNFTYSPFINGSYQKYNGQYHQVSQTGEYKAKIDDVVYMSDSPAKIFKGGMFFRSGDEYFLLRNYYDSIRTPAPLPTDVKPFGEIQSQDVWAQYEREMGIFSGNIRGLDSDVQDADNLPDNPDLIHNYLLTDSNAATNNKVFLNLSFSQDRKAQISSTTLVEIYDSVEGKTPGDHIFKYLSQ